MVVPHVLAAPPPAVVAAQHKAKKRQRAVQYEELSLEQRVFMPLDQLVKKA